MSGAELECLLAEIGEQPAVVARLLDRQQDAVRSVARTIRQRQPSGIVLVARGSSDNAAVYGRYLLEVCNRRLTSLAAPSGLTLYGRGPRLDHTVVIGVSQSGRGEDVVAYVREARKQGAVTVAIVNDEASPLAQTAEWVLACQAGAELSIPATKTVTAQMTLLAMLSAALGEDETRADSLAALAPGQPDRALTRTGPSSLVALPDALRAAQERRPAAASLARLLASGTLGAVIGRGFAFPTALEIALKLKETSYTPAEPFSAADFLHGPVALVEPGYSALLVDVGGRSSEAAQEVAAAIRERGGQPALLRAADGKRLPESAYRDASISAASSQSGQPRPGKGKRLPESAYLADLSLDVPVPEPFAPIVAVVLGQLLAVELALARGLDPARPRGLRKVTSTR